MKACLGWNASEKRCSYGGECRGCRGYREGLLAAARMASARAGVYGHSVGCGGRPSPSERLQYIHDRCSRCQFKRLASDLRKKAKGKP